jgi:hypothetical protein
MIDFKTYINKVLVFYYPEKAGYWNSITKCSIVEKPLELGNYYLDFSSKANYPGNFNKQGIPLYSYRTQASLEQPIVIAQYALGLFSVLQRRSFCDDQLKAEFLNVADWFVKNGEIFNNGVVWKIPHLYPQYGLDSPWISAMAQGEVISVLTRAFKLVNKPVYQIVANNALEPFKFNVSDGGIKTLFMNQVVFEEFPSKNKAMAVLNGHIFALFGLYDLWLSNKNEDAKLLFDKGVESIIKLLPIYDCNNWSNYFLYEYPKKYYSSYTYHVLVTEQLKVLYILTDEPLLNDYAKKWDDYSKSFVKKNIALFQKLFFSNKINP